MTTRRTRLTRRGGMVVAVVAVAAAGAVGFGGSALMRVGQPDCTAEAQGREVALSSDEAQSAALAVAGVVRRSGTSEQAASAVQSEVELTRAEAVVVGDALSGRSRAAFTCLHGGSGDSESDDLDDTGLTGRAAVVAQDVEAAFGDLPLGGFAPGGVSTGHMRGSAHYDGRAVDVFFRPINAANKQRGWAVAQYLVAHAERLAVNTVIFDAKIWTARRAGSGWRDYDIDRDGRSVATLRILEHRDHVHVDVAD